MVQNIRLSWKFAFTLLVFLGATSPLTAYFYHPASVAMNNSVARMMNLAVEPAPRTEQTLNEHFRHWRQAPDNPWLALELGLDYLHLASADRWDYLEKAQSYFEKARKGLPHNAVVLMNLGRALGAQALNEDHSVFQRLRWAREGFRFMDKALEQDPDNTFLRLLRAEAALLAHPILRRGSKLTEDANAVQAFVTSTDFADLTNYQQARFHLFIGSYLAKEEKQSDSMRHHWSMATQLAHNTPLGQEAMHRLRGTFVNIGYEGD